MKNVDKITPTKSQKKLIHKFKKFFESSEKYFLLTGKPGVGKTTIVQIILEHLIKLDRENDNRDNPNVAGITLAHRAKNVLGEFVPNVFTFAKAYGMKELYDDNGARKFVYDKYANDKGVVGDKQVPAFVHDEVSQYTKEMLGIVMERTSMFSKVIFIGDIAQLPPIDAEGEMEVDEDSPVFDLDLPDYCRHELTERVRQKEGNSLLDLTDIIREEILGGQSIQRMMHAISEPIMKDGKGFGHITYPDFLNHYESRDPEDTRLIACRNKTVKYFNNNIRDYLFRNPTEAVINDDFICMTDNFKGNCPPPNQGTFYLYNSDSFKVTGVHTKVVSFNTSIKKYYIECFQSGILNDVYKMFLTPTPNGFVEYQKALNELGSACKSRKMKWSEFWDFKDSFCQYTYGYCITAYKAQGSTFKTVYVDINDILMTGPLTPKRALQTAYTAISRAQEDVYFLKGKR